MTMTTSVSTAELKKRLSEYLGRVLFRKESFVVTRRGRPVARLTPASEGRPRHLGEVRGWLDAEDPFFENLDRIVAARRTHRPRSLPR